MNAAQLINEAVLLEDVYKYSSTQVNLPKALADYVIKWGREMIPDEHLYYDEDGGCGREDEAHVTVLYGLTDKQPPKALLKLLKDTPPFTVRLTGITFFEAEDYDVVKFDIESDELKALSNSMRQVCPNENKFPKYIPHCTVAYVKKGRVPDLAGSYPFEQNPPVPAEFEVNEIIFKPAGESGDPKRKTLHLPLNRFVKEAEDPKSVLRQAQQGQRLAKPMLFKDVPEDSLFRGIDWTLMRKKGDQVETAGVTRPLGNPGYLCYPPDWNMGTIKSYSRNYNRRSRQEAESPKAALELNKITRPLRFKYVPDGFYFRTPNCELVKKVYDPDTGSNAVTTDLDMVRRVIIPDRHWCFPPKWTVDDITSCQQLESLLESEDPKSVFRLAKAAMGRWVLARGFDAYGEVLPDTMYFHYNDKDPEFVNATWTKNFDAATQFRSEDEAWNALKKVFGDDISYWKGGVDTQVLHPNDVKLEAEDPKSIFNKMVEMPLRGGGLIVGKWKGAGPESSWSYWGDFPEGGGWTPSRHQATRYAQSELRAALDRIQTETSNYMLRVISADGELPSPQFEAEDPKAVLKAAASDAFVIWTYDAGNHNYMVVENRPRGRVYWWTGESHLATRFKDELEAWVALREFYHEPDIKQFGIRVTPAAQAAAFVGEKQRTPFDFLNFPTDASVLAAKLLDLDGVEKPTVL